MMSSLLVVARTVPESEDGVQLSGVKRLCVLTVRIAGEPAETPGAIEEPGPRQAGTRLADDERGDERAVRRRVLLHQVLQSFRHPMDGMGWQYLKSARQLLVGNDDTALGDTFEKCTRPYLRRHPLVLQLFYFERLLPDHMGPFDREARRAQTYRADRMKPAYDFVPCMLDIGSSIGLKHALASLE